MSDERVKCMSCGWCGIDSDSIEHPNPFDHDYVLRGCPKCNCIDMFIPLYTDKELDEFYYHELIDRTHLIMNMIDEYISMHPVCEKHRSLKGRANTALMMLGEVYRGASIIDNKIHGNKGSDEDE